MQITLIIFIWGHFHGIFGVVYNSTLSGTEEHFRDKCGGLPSWFDKQQSYTVFVEGWALYAENPLLSHDTDLYKDNMLQEYGMTKWQVR